MSTKYDLDLAFGEEPEITLDGIDEATLAAQVAALPAALRDVAFGLLLEKHSMSDVSQALSIRQSELVTRLHRAKAQIAENLGL